MRELVANFCGGELGEAKGSAKYDHEEDQRGMCTPEKDWNLFKTNKHQRKMYHVKVEYRYKSLKDKDDVDCFLVWY